MWGAHAEKYTEERFKDLQAEFAHYYQKNIRIQKFAGSEERSQNRFHSVVGLNRKII